MVDIFRFMATNASRHPFFSVVSFVGEVKAPRNKAGVTDDQYRDAIESCAAFNVRLLAEAKERSYPYLDNQTGIAHEPRRSLWVTEQDRCVIIGYQLN